MAACSNGHESDWDDYCSVCGEQMAGAAAAEPASEPEPSAETPSEPEEAAVPGLSCPNCSETYAEGDVFCENCGYDFLSGTLPEEAVPVAAVQSSGKAIISIDLAFFERMQFAGVEPPAELPQPVEVVLPPTDILVGRHSESRGTFPEIDLSAIFGDGSPATDPAVSSSHCRLHRSANGWTVTDLDSTNGTFVGDETEGLAAGRPMNLTPGTPIYVGAWTKIELVD